MPAHRPGAAGVRTRRAAAAAVAEARAACSPRAACRTPRGVHSSHGRSRGLRPGRPSRGVRTGGAGWARGGAPGREWEVWVQRRLGHSLPSGRARHTVHGRVGGG